MALRRCPAGYERLVNYRLGSGTLSKASNLLADARISTRYSGPRVEVVGQSRITICVPSQDMDRARGILRQNLRIP